MAYNLFSKLHRQTDGLKFVVCDANADTAKLFSTNFTNNHSDAVITLAESPEQYVVSNSCCPARLLIVFSSAVLMSNRIVTMLPSSPEVKHVYTDFVIPALQRLSGADSKETFCIDSTTLDVDVAREVATDVSKTGAQMIDAPVSGGKSFTGLR